MKYLEGDLNNLRILFLKTIDNPDFKRLTHDEFALWWRSHSDQERQDIYDNQIAIYEEEY